MGTREVTNSDATWTYTKLKKGRVNPMLLGLLYGSRGECIVALRLVGLLYIRTKGVSWQ